jgi:hypothetical protein
MSQPQPKPKIFSSNNPVSVTIGTRTYTNIVLFAEKPTGVNGKATEPRTTPNNTSPVGYTYLHKYREIKIVIDSCDVQEDMENDNIWNEDGDNPPVVLKIMQRRGDGPTRTKTYVTENTVLDSMEQTLEQLKDREVTELNFNTYGKPTVTAWT